MKLDYMVRSIKAINKPPIFHSILFTYLYQNKIIFHVYKETILLLFKKKKKKPYTLSQSDSASQAQSEKS